MFRSFMFYFHSWNHLLAPQQDSAVVETVPPNNTSAITSNNARYLNVIGIYCVPLTFHSGSFFHKANNIVVRDGAFYAAHKLVIKKVQGEESS